MPHAIISGAFGSYTNKHGYLFMKNVYVSVNYNTGAKKEKLSDGPILIADWLPELVGMPFENGVHGAFAYNATEAYIFSENLCCRIDFDPKHLYNAKILEGPVPIVSIFPYLNHTVFVHGIETAIYSPPGNVFITKGGMYAHINVDSKKLLAYKSIRSAFPSLVGTVFETGIDSGFGTSMTESYIFKGNYYAQIVFNQANGSDDRLTGPIKYILDDWTCLREILESENCCC